MQTECTSSGFSLRLWDQQQHTYIAIRLKTNLPIFQEENCYTDRLLTCVHKNYRTKLQTIEIDGACSLPVVRGYFQSTVWLWRSYVYSWCFWHCFKHYSQHRYQFLFSTICSLSTIVMSTCISVHTGLRALAQSVRHRVWSGRHPTDALQGWREERLTLSSRDVAWRPITLLLMSILERPSDTFISVYCIWIIVVLVRWRTVAYVWRLCVIVENEFSMIALA